MELIQLELITSMSSTIDCKKPKGLETYALFTGGTFSKLKKKTWIFSHLDLHARWIGLFIQKYGSDELNMTDIHEWILFV